LLLLWPERADFANGGSAVALAAVEGAGLLAASVVVFISQGGESRRGKVRMSEKKTLSFITSKDLR
jgi:hypothetical protein